MDAELCKGAGVGITGEKFLSVVVELHPLRLEMLPLNTLKPFLVDLRCVVGSECLHNSCSWTTRQSLVTNSV